MGRAFRRLSGLGLAALVASAVGCSTVGESLGFNTPTSPLLNEAKDVRDAAPVPAPLPRELAKELLPPHVVEPGDTLLVQPVDFDSPVRLPPDQPVQPDGTIDLGKYGRPVVAGKTLAQVEEQVRAVVKAQEKGEKDTAVAVTVRLIGRGGRVFYVLGEVNAPGSFPVTGSETVLDAIIRAGGLTRRASESNVILSRPTYPDGCRLVYPVCYGQIVQLGDTTTNYQLQPGDRVFVPSKGTFEGLLPPRCRRTAGACSRPQVPCFGGACATPGGALPAIPVAPHHAP